MVSAPVFEACDLGVTEFLQLTRSRRVVAMAVDDHDSRLSPGGRGCAWPEELCQAWRSARVFLDGREEFAVLQLDPFMETSTLVTSMASDSVHEIVVVAM